MPGYQQVAPAELKKCTGEAQGMKLETHVAAFRATATKLFFALVAELTARDAVEPARPISPRTDRQAGRPVLA